MFEIPGKHSRSDRHHDRAEAVIAHLAAEFIARESNNQSLITVTRVQMSPKGERADILVTVFPDDKSTSALDFLNRNAGEFRDYLKTHSRMRDLPRVTFLIDAGEKNRQHLDELGASL